MASLLPRTASRAARSMTLRPATSLPRNNPLHIPRQTTTIPLPNTTRPFSSSTPLQTDLTQPPYSPPFKDLFSLQNHIILITGGARGLGLTQAAALLSAGAKVHALDLLPPTPEFLSVQQSFPSGALTAHQVDVRDQSALATIVGGIAEKEGKINGLVAAAGIQQETPALEYKKEDVDKMMGVNVTGVFMTAQAVAREMIARKQRGSLVLVGSMSGTVANRGLICPAYNASKAAVLQLARNLAAEWGEHGIRVNSLSPGYIVTAMTAGLFDAFPERRTAWPDANMLKRLSYPEEYRGAAIFLLSEASSFMTGADLRVDGGHCAW
ncbi:Putative D-arabinitol 2-dehydrogenase [ribulose-forming] [Podospora comata]|uniref:D-arabinitol 2-dehydrogenase [ribulose-forming] n=1 Tax=Podospora comata TaxID=48703 RepID=A0ABY6RU38_PODCO|nr:Putative D-arabinitol 2-dehydrogenase [ribulose-forming] [Podospora comata]